MLAKIWVWTMTVCISGPAYIFPAGRIPVCQTRDTSIFHRAYPASLWWCLLCVSFYRVYLPESHAWKSGHILLCPDLKVSHKMVDMKSFGNRLSILQFWKCYFIRKRQKGGWMMNPDNRMKGNAIKRRKLLSEYSEIQSIKDKGKEDADV